MQFYGTKILLSCLVSVLALTLWTRQCQLQYDDYRILCRLIPYPPKSLKACSCLLNPLKTFSYDAAAASLSKIITKAVVLPLANRVRCVIGLPLPSP